MPQPIHVDYSSENEEPPPRGKLLTFDDTNGEPILRYRGWSTTRNRFPDGWVLDTADGDEYIVGAWDLDLDQAVTRAQEHLARMAADGDD
ncbi:MAG: hypothetical protein WA622_27030 [Mycobacterium sp.]|uniref:hypothetical protein n=1 Tax=Mycobacterium sp. TaxID=1785 RepID=UPI003C3E52CD